MALTWANDRFAIMFEFANGTAGPLLALHYVF